MRTRRYLWILSAGILLGISPVLASADVSHKVSENLSLDEISVIDSLLRNQKPRDKDQKKPDRKEKGSKKRTEADPDVDIKREPRIGEVDPRKPNIKEVPRARPKLRPGTVTDRVKIKRPPVRVKPGRVLHSVGF